MAGRDIIIMSQRELKRLHIIRKVLEGKLKQVGAAAVLHLSGRQIRRIVKRIRREGDKGIAHRARRRPSNSTIPKKLKDKIIKLYQDKYKGFGPTLAAEKLFEIDKIKLSDETLRNWLIECGQWKKSHKPRKHCHWRQRKHHFGEMVQMDGSHHDWLEGRSPRCVLMGYIDDATNTAFARFYEYEGTIPAMDSLRRYIKRYSVPYSVYLDKHSTYKLTAQPSIEDQLNNTLPLSQFERALGELGIEAIHAHSPQAKGRVERLFRTFQDRLIKEMRLKGIKTIAEANKFLAYYLPVFNRRFSVEPMEKENFHRPLPQDISLDTVLSIKTGHFLRNDFTIAHEKKLYQILDRINAKKVTVEERTNGKIHITYKGKHLKYNQIIQRPVKEKSKKPYMFKIREAWRPPMDHPLKRAMFERRIRQVNAYSQQENLHQKEKELVLTKT